MTTEELRLQIANSKYAELFNSLNTVISIAHINYQQTFTGVSALNKFIEQQIKGWQELGNDLPNELTQVVNFYNSFIQDISNFINRSESIQSSENSIKNEWTNLTSSFNSNNNRNKLFLYEYPEVTFLINVFRNNKKYYTPVFNFIANQDVNNINNKDYFIIYVIYLLMIFYSVTNQTI